MKIQNLEQLRDLIKNGWRVDCKQKKESDWRGTWSARCGKDCDNEHFLEQGKYKLKSPQGEIIPVEYCKGELDEHTFKVGDKVRCKPGYNKGVPNLDHPTKGGGGYEPGEEFVIRRIDKNGNRYVAWDVSSGVYTRALELVVAKVTEPYIGMRVKRGPDWDYDNQGCGHGTIISLSPHGGDYVEVLWDDTTIEDYPFSEDGVVEDTDYVKPKEEPVWNGKVLECTEGDIQESVGFGTVWFKRSKEYSLVTKYDYNKTGKSIDLGIDTGWGRATGSKDGCYDLFLLKDNEYVRIVDKVSPIKEIEGNLDEFKLNEGLGEPVDGNIHIDTTIGTNIWDNQKIEVGDTVGPIDTTDLAASKDSSALVSSITGDNMTLLWLKNHNGQMNGNYYTKNYKVLTKKGEVATPVSSDKQVNTNQDGCKSNEVRNINQQDRVRNKQGGEGIQSRRGRTTVESRPIVYKEITSSFKKSGSVG